MKNNLQQINITLEGDMYLLCPDKLPTSGKII